VPNTQPRSHRKGAPRRPIHILPRLSDTRRLLGRRSSYRCEELRENLWMLLREIFMLMFSAFGSRSSGTPGNPSPAVRRVGGAH